MKKLKLSSFQKGIISVVVAGWALNFSTAAFSEWDKNIVKIPYILQHYATSKETSESYSKKSDFLVLEDRTEQIINSVNNVQNQLTAILIHLRVAYTDEKNCPYPPCESPKKKKDTRIVINDDLG